MEAFFWGYVLPTIYTAMASVGPLIWQKLRKAHEILKTIDASFHRVELAVAGVQGTIDVIRKEYEATRQLAAKAHERLDKQEFLLREHDERLATHDERLTALEKRPLFP
jgi:hypothetical protein